MNTDKPQTTTQKEYSDTCFNCGENKLAIKYSQKIKDPIFCVIMSHTEAGSEVVAEYDKHRFVRTEKQRIAEEETELEYVNQMGEMAEWAKKNPIEELA